MREILKGVIDLHVHAGPSVAKREVDAGDMLREAVQYGYRAFVVKDHYFPTMMSAQLVEKHLDSKIRVFGGIALNNSVGGINVKAVNAANGMGAKFVYMPTVSSSHHINEHKGHHFPGAGAMSVEEKPITYIDEQGNLLPEVAELLRYLAESELILATGHGSVAEIDALISEAVRTGVKKIFVNHPFFLIGASVAQIAKWAKLGAYIELNACVFPTSDLGTIPWETAGKILENVEINKLVIDSDYGQKGNGSPVEGLYNFIMALMKNLGVTERQISMMTKETPAKLLGI